MNSRVKPRRDDPFNGVLAHLVERLHGMQEVQSSSLWHSTIHTSVMRGTWCGFQNRLRLVRVQPDVPMPVL